MPPLFTLSGQNQSQGLAQPGGLKVHLPSGHSCRMGGAWAAASERACSSPLTAGSSARTPGSFLGPRAPPGFRSG